MFVESFEGFWEQISGEMGCGNVASGDLCACVCVGGGGGVKHLSLE